MAKNVSACEALGPTIVELVKAGMRPLAASQACGLSRNTIYNWVKRGNAERERVDNGLEPNEDETPYMEFVEKLQKAEAECQAGLVLAWVKEARQGDWKAAEKFLSKRFPDEWGDQNTMRVEVSGVGGAPIQATMKHQIDDDESRKRAVLEALVESGDLPSNVLEVWDAESEEVMIDGHQEETGSIDGVEEAMWSESSTQSAPEADGILDMDDY